MGTKLRLIKDAAKPLRNIRVTFLSNASYLLKCNFHDTTGSRASSVQASGQAFFQPRGQVQKIGLCGTGVLE